MELILNTYGVCLNRDNEGFVITTTDGKQKIPPASISSIQICKGAQISSDAVMLAVEKEIEIIFVGKSGKPIGRVWSPKYGSISTIRKGQLNFTYTHEAVEWIKNIIMTKIDHQQAMMLLLKADDSETTKEVDRSRRRMEDYKMKISKLDGFIVNDIAATLRGWEGQASKIYFDTLNLFIPDQFRMNRRTQHPALDVTNAFLNYGYGLLYSKIEGSMIKAGIDPYIGVMHRDDYNRPVLVYDVIELYRVWVEYVVYRLIAQNIITDEYYSIREDGSYWLEGMGRRVLIQSVNDYLDEEITQKGVTRSRNTQMFLYIQNLAQKFKTFSDGL